MAEEAAPGEDPETTRSRQGKGEKMKNLTILTLTLALCAGAANALELEKIGAREAAALASGIELPAAGPVLADRGLAAGQHIQKEVGFKNRAFAELLVRSLKTKPVFEQMFGGQRYAYKVGDGLACYRTFVNDAHVPGQPVDAGHYCSILPTGRWKFMGMESYGSGDDQEFSLALFEALNVKAKNEGGIYIKSIELEMPDQAGGTERNQLTCMKPGPQAAAMGFRPTCQFMNGL